MCYHFIIVIICTLFHLTVTFDKFTQGYSKNRALYLSLHLFVCKTLNVKRTSHTFCLSHSFHLKTSIIQRTKKRYIYRGEMRRPFSPERKFIAYRQWPHMENNTQTRTQTHTGHIEHTNFQTWIWMVGNESIPFWPFWEMRDHRSLIVEWWCWYTQILKAKHSSVRPQSEVITLWWFVCVFFHFQFSIKRLLQWHSMVTEMHPKIIKIKPNCKIMAIDEFI